MSNSVVKMASVPASGPAPVKRSDWDLTKRILRETRDHRLSLWVAIVLYAPLTLAQLAQPLCIGFAVDRGFRQGDAGAVSQWAALYLLAVIVRSLLETAQLFLLQRLGQRAVLTLRVSLFDKIQRLPMAYFDKTPLGKLMTRVTNDTESVAELFSSGSVSIFGDILFLLGTLVMLLSVNVELSLITLTTLPILFIGVQWFRKRARVAFQNVRQAMSSMNALLQEQISGMVVVQLFGQSARMRERFEKENESYMRANRDAIFLDAGVYAFVDGVSTIAVALALCAASLWQSTAVAGGTATSTVATGLTLGTLVLFVDALGRFFMPIRELSNKTTIFQSAFVAAERIIELEEEPETIAAPASPKPVVFQQAIAFDDVRFKYATGNEILRGISLTVKKGEHIALVGHTGAGKSTIMKLLPRMYDVTGGRITIDGVDLREFAPDALRQITTAVPQDVFLFQGTLRDNMRRGKRDATDAEIMAALAACQATGMVSRHGGLDGLVSERGQSLSLGERQLVAMARALLSDPPIVILDEATASVDRATERVLQAATERLLKGRTALIVAHRLSTIERCDRIFVLHQGEIVEEGTHEQLKFKGGRYATLLALQQQAA